MKKKGFTLVELLGVIVIIGILALIAVPTVVNIIKQSHTDAYNQQLSTIRMALQNWKMDNSDLLPSEGEKIYLSINQLKVGNYLPSDFIDPRTDSAWPNDMIVSIENNNGYQYNIDESSGTKTDKYTEATPSITMNMNPVIFLKIGEPYVAPTVEIHDADGSLLTHSEVTSSITGTSKTIDTSVAGNYLVKYTSIVDNVPVCAVQNVFVGDVTNLAKVYGLRWDGNDHYTRLGAAAGMTSCVGTTTESCVSDFDSAEIYKDIHDVIIGEDSFVYIPKFYIKKVVTGDTWEWYISKRKIDDSYYLPECFYDIETSSTLPYVLVGKYLSSLNGSDLLVSKSGVLPQTTKNINEFRDYALNKNDATVSGYQLFDIHTLDAIQTLFYIEFGTLNSQTIMTGNVRDNSNPLTSGLTNGVKASSGSDVSNTDAVHMMMYRGIENLYGSLWQFIDGVNVNNDDNCIYVNRNSKTYASDKNDGDYTKLGYSKINEAGFVTKMGYDSNYPFAQFPTAVDASGSANYAYGDYYYYDSAAGYRVVLYGGAHRTDYNYGINHFVFDSDSTKAISEIGARLVKKTK